jgi:hypothetical protein
MISQETMNMKSFTIKPFSSRLVRVLTIAFVSAFLFLTTTVPAFAAAGFGSTPSKPSDGTAQLGKIEARSQDIAESKVAPGSMEESEARAQGGINEVQGAADKDKMSRPSNSQDATTVTDQIGKALKKAVD